MSAGLPPLGPQARAVVTDVYSLQRKMRWHLRWGLGGAIAAAVSFFLQASALPTPLVRLGIVAGALAAGINGWRCARAAARANAAARRQLGR